MGRDPALRKMKCQTPSTQVDGDATLIFRKFKREDHQMSGKREKVNLRIQENKEKNAQFCNRLRIYSHEFGQMRKIFQSLEITDGGVQKTLG